MKNIKDQKFGRLLALNPIRTDHRGSKVWNCRCDCGNFHEVVASRLITGKTKSCGCLKTGPNRDDSIIGEKFNSLLVLAYVDSDSHRSSRYLVRCDCGKEFISYKNGLKKRKTCRKCSFVLKNKFFEFVPNWYFNNIKSQAKARKKEFNISIEYINDLYKLQNKKCAYSNRELNFALSVESGLSTASLDRIDNLKGYVEGNVQWVHKDINYMKSDMTSIQFIQFCQEVTECQNTKLKLLILS